MKSSNHLIKTLFFLGLFLLCQHTAFAQEIKLTNLNVDNTRDDLLVYFNVNGAFQDKIKASVLIGVPTTFSFFVALYQVRNIWIDKKIEELKITHVIKYNTLKKEFVVSRSWEKEKSRVTKTFSEAQQLMNNINQLKVVTLSRLEKDRLYRIKLKAEIKKGTPPAHLHYVSDFLTKWSFATEWYTIDFLY